MIVKTAEQVKAFVNQDQAASFWLRNAINDLDKRDIVDAWADAKYLYQWIDQKCKESGMDFDKN